MPDEEVKWPNQHPVVDGVTPTEQVSQDPKFFDEPYSDLEMED